MRHRALVFLTLLTLAACGNNPAGGADAPTNADAASVDSAIDGGPIDALIDAPPPIDAPTPGLITVIVNDMAPPATPLAGTWVVFVNPDGQIADAKLTDANGVATALVLPGASITVVYGANPHQVWLETVASVAPGDSIVVGPFDSSDPTVTGTFTVNVPDYPGAGYYEVFGPCGSSRNDGPVGGALTPVVLSMSAYCQEPAMELVAVAHDISGNAQGWIEAPGVSYADGGSSTMTSAWKPMQTLSLTFTNVAPTSFDEVSTGDIAPDAKGYGVGATVPYATQPKTISLQVPSTSTALVETDFFQSIGSSAEERILDVVDGTNTTYALDVATALLPVIVRPRLDLSSGTVTVSGATRGDFLDVLVRYTRPDGGGTDVFTWEVWTPPVESIVLPALPAQLAADYPAASDGHNVGFATLYEADAITDWSQIRGHLISSLQRYYLGRAGLGRLVVSEISGYDAPFAPTSRGPRGHQRAPRIRR